MGNPNENYQLAEKLKPYNELRHRALEALAHLERRIRVVGDDMLDHWVEAEAKARAEITRGLGNFEELLKIRERVEESQKKRAEAKTLWDEWENKRKEIDTIEVTMEKVRDAHKINKGG